MSAAAISFRAPVLPWSFVIEDEKRFKRILRTVLAISAIVCLMLLLMPRPVENRAAPVELPPRLAKLVIEQRETPKPPPAPVVKANDAPVAQKEAAKPEQAKPEAPTPKPQPAQASKVPAARDPIPGKPPGENLESARRKAAGVGLLAMKDDLNQLAAVPAAVQLNQDIKPGKGIGAGTGVGVGMGTEAGIPTRALITSNATNGSGGINLDPSVLMPGPDDPTNPHRFKDPNVPPVLPVVNLVIGVDFRLPQVRGWEGRIEGGFYNAFFLGTAIGYTF